MLAEKEEREKHAKKIFILKANSDSGLEDIKEILSLPDVDIHYLGSSLFSIEAIASNFKEANTKVNMALEQIEKHSKEKKAQFELKEK